MSRKDKVELTVKKSRPVTGSGSACELLEKEETLFRGM